MISPTRQKFFAGAILAVLSLLYSCIPDHYDLDKIDTSIEIHPGLAAPLVYGTLSIQDILNKADSNNYVKQFDDSLLYLTYYEDLLSYPASEVVDIPDQDFFEVFISPDVNIPDWLISSVGDTVTFTKEKNSTFVLTHNERLDSVYIKTATLNVNVTSSFQHRGILTIHSDNIIVDGEPFKEVIQISDASGSFTYNTDIPLDGAKLYLEQNSSDTTVLPLIFDLELINSGQPIQATDSCNITMAFKDIAFNSVYGYLGDYNVLMNNGEVNVSLFNDTLNGGHIRFMDPRLSLNVENSYGIPMEITLSNVTAYSAINNVATDIVFNGVNPFLINAPDLTQVGDTVNTTIMINKDNCNIQEAMATEPNSFTYEVRASTNPGGAPLTDNNFVTDSSDLKVGFEVVLPIWISADGFSLEDTLDFNFEDQFGSDTDMIDYLRLTMDASNGIPMRVNMQMYFTDENYNIVDSLFHDNDLLLAGALLDSNDKVSEKVDNSKAVEFTTNRIETLKPVKYAIIHARVNTKDAATGKYVRFYSYYTVDFKLKVRAKFTINSNDLGN